MEIKSLLNSLHSKGYIGDELFVLQPYFKDVVELSLLNIEILSSPINDKELVVVKLSDGILFNQDVSLYSILLINDDVYFRLTKNSLRKQSITLFSVKLSETGKLINIAEFNENGILSWKNPLAVILEDDTEVITNGNCDFNIKTVFDLRWLFNSHENIKLCIDNGIEIPDVGIFVKDTESECSKCIYYSSKSDDICIGFCDRFKLEGYFKH